MIAVTVVTGTGRTQEVGWERPHDRNRVSSPFGRWALAWLQIRSPHTSGDGGGCSGDVPHRRQRSVISRPSSWRMRHARARGRLRRLCDAEKMSDRSAAFLHVKDLIFTKGAATMGGSPHHEGFIPAEDNAQLLDCAMRARSSSARQRPAWEDTCSLATAPSAASRAISGSWRGQVATQASAPPLRSHVDVVHWPWQGDYTRVPAAFCGVVGFKPTFGLIPRAPGFRPPPWASLVHTGRWREAWLMRHVLGNIVRHDHRDPASLHVSPPCCSPALP